MSLLQKNWQEIHIFQSECSLLDNYLSAYHKTREDIVKSSFSDFLSPFLFQDAQKAVQIITECIKKNERILIFGDYDLDGMSGTAQLFLTLKHVGANVSYRLPSRADGYGLNTTFIEEAHQKQVKLFITTDCGVSNISEIQKAKQLGMQVIITDHHSVPDVLPPADAILHPLVKSESFPDKHLTGAGVAWYLCRAILQTALPQQESQSIEKELLEITLLGTVADCGLLTGENRKIVEQGLQQLKTSNNPGLKKLIKVSKSDPSNITAATIGFFIAPRLNASGRLAHPKISLELLLGNSKRAEDLEELNKARQEMVEDFLIEAMDQVKEEEAALLVKSQNWPGGVIGLISGKLAEKFGKPVIAFEETSEKITGSCRGPEDFHIANALKEIKKQHPNWFFGCGGHAQAAGLSIYPKYFKVFCEAYKNKVIQKRGKYPKPAFIQYCGTIEREISIGEVEDLKKGEPFGVGNPSPVFLFPDITVLKKKTVGNNNQHLSLFCKSNGINPQPFSVIWFRGGELSQEITERQKISILATPEAKEWNNQKSIGLRAVDISVGGHPQK